MFKLAQLRKRDKGNQQVPKYRTVPKLASESSTCSPATTEENLVMFQEEQSSHNGVTGKPMKKLLAEEMSKEAVAKKKSPSVIAKLMGLDGVGQRQKLRLLDIDTKRTDSIGAERDEKPRDSKSSRKNLEGKHGSKDMFDYREASNVPVRRKSSKQSEWVNISKEESSVTRMKHEEREADEIHRQWRRKSNQDLMEKFLQQPDSLFVKHVLEQQSHPSSSQCRHIAVLRPTNSIKCEANAKGWKRVRETSRKCDMDSYRRHDDKLLDRGSGTHSSLRSSKIRLEVKEEANIPPRRIVVLKPSFGQTDNAAQCVFSLDDFRKQDLAINKREAGSLAEEGVFDETEFSCHKCREARKIAKVITRQIRDSFGSSGDLHSSIGKSRVRGYDREESLYMSDSDSEVVITLTSANFYTGWYDHDNPPLPRTAEFSVSREAKKRMSERWKKTHGYIDVEEIAQGSTLGEMLSAPDRKMRSESLKAVKGLDGTSGGAAYSAERDTPMGISSRDGWKDGYLGSGRRSGSVPPSFGSQRHKSSEHREVLADERILKHREPMKRDRSKAVKGHVSEREFKSIRSNKKKLYPSQRRHTFTIKSTNSVPKINSSQKLIEVNFEIDDLAEEKPLVPQTPDGISTTAFGVDAKVNNDIIMSLDLSRESLPLLSTCAQINSEIDDLAEEKPLLPQTPDGISSTAFVVDEEVNTDVKMCSDSSSELLPLLSTIALGDRNSSALQEDLPNLKGPSNGKSEEYSDSLQFPGPEPEGESETSEISKEADHHSPVSILQVPSTENLSSGSDSFGRVNADLQELRMHLQQLKMESDGSYLVQKSISEDKEAEEVAFDEEGSVGHDCWDWESSYIVDLLVESGLYGTDPGSFILNCYSADCPLNPSLFDTLEKKYSDETTGPRRVRKLLFDHINELLLEIYQSAMDSCPWVKPVKLGLSLKWEIGRVEDQLQKFLEIHDKEAHRKVSDTVFDKHPSWFEPREVVDAVGKQIQELLLDDLIKEVI